MEVAKSAAVDLKRVHLELGGKAPVIVFADAELEKAAAQIVVAGFFNAGQDCTAATRVLVHESVHDEFVALLKAEVAANALTGDQSFPSPPAHFESSALSFIAPKIPSKSSGMVVR